MTGCNTQYRSEQKRVRQGVSLEIQIKAITQTKGTNKKARCSEQSNNTVFRGKQVK